MKYAISVTDTKKVNEIEDKGKQVLNALNEYIPKLEQLTKVEQPRGMVFHDFSSATELYSEIPIPAYTSRDLIHLNPEPSVWKEIFFSTVVPEKMGEVYDYYSETNVREVAMIAAHEWTHHAEFFHDDFEGDEENMWFEEGMCEYIPRTFMLDEQERVRLSRVEYELIQFYKSEFGEYPLVNFGQAGYRMGNNESFTAAFYDYWRSAWVVERLVEDYFDGSLTPLIQLYQSWDQSQPLHDFFIEELHISDHTARELWLKR
ncbi:hypothetical protein LCL89_03585 [Halobacillus yeomjeoni]|uniref:hypothetical protein n=1 Tax=Halobacillus yeomjeoni TaxID=311194 RepID=UPI001CD3ABE4|nr:hypothetical protein [Halobacillus yeomjeoni]MCA0983127.1 hypothetical protein [Halobacillus yeomjeoni]